MKVISLFTKQLEKSLAHFPTLINLYGLYYKDIVKREVELGHIIPEDRILVIGGGPLPCTAMEIADQTGAKIVVVDKDPKAVEIARRVIKRYNMEDQIKVKLADGINISAVDYSVIHVALQVCNRTKVLQNILSKAPQGARILVRSQRDVLKRMYSALPAWCKNCRFVEQKNSTMKATLLLIKGQEKIGDDEKVCIIANRRLVGYSST
ncbi:nicotianamine synthase family protein [Desulfofalx alkaliphila]|uniref:nicotianamine synthase family protein n=1 Tax=Desulfofalx alkaliphila TaxID=105483 RepID=UPI0004E25D00|nr:nicotianamine synthase family protein [Desulfofalx alkaliphila]